MKQTKLPNKTCTVSNSTEKRSMKHVTHNYATKSCICNNKVHKLIPLELF